MYVVCPDCQTSYILDGAQIGAEGKAMRCSNCGAAWRQFPPPVEPEIPEVEADLEFADNPGQAGMGELGVYARYEEIDRSRTGARFEEERYSTGFNYWPTDQVAFKFTYETVEDVDASTNTDNFYFGIGYQF